MLRKTGYAVFLAFFWACSWGCDGKPPTSPTATPSARPTVTIMCNGSRDSCTVGYSQAATISWSSTDASACTITGRPWTGTSGSQSTGELTSNQNFEARCTNAGGEAATASVRVNVGALSVPGNFTLSGTCAAIDSANQRANLSWTASSDAASYRVERHAWSTGAWGSVGTTNTTSFAQVVQSDTDFYYRVTATNDGGEKVSAPAELFVCGNKNPPPPAPVPPPPPAPNPPPAPVPPPPPAPNPPGPTPVPGPLAISFTSVPPRGSSEDLRVAVSGVIANDHKVVVYIYVGGWWIKPTDTAPLTAINGDGSAVVDITTGGVDETATQIIAFLVTNNHPPVIALNFPSIPIAVNGRDVLAVVTVTR